MEFDQTSTDTSLGWGKEVIRFWWLWPHFKVSLALWNSNFDRKKSICAHYLLNHWLEFDQTSTDTSIGGGKKWLDVGDFDLIFKSLRYKDSKNEPCVPPISWIYRGNLTKLTQVYQWDGGKKWLDFGHLDLIFKFIIKGHRDSKGNISQKAVSDTDN